jgi:hypothetical protein
MPRWAIIGLIIVVLMIIIMGPAVAGSTIGGFITDIFTFLKSLGSSTST